MAVTFNIYLRDGLHRADYLVSAYDRIHALRLLMVKVNINHVEEIKIWPVLKRWKNMPHLEREEVRCVAKRRRINYAPT